MTLFIGTLDVFPQFAMIYLLISLENLELNSTFFPGLSNIQSSYFQIQIVMKMLSAHRVFHVKFLAIISAIDLSTVKV